jgi:hypothetical protein
MSWQWETRLQAWATQVTLSGKFVMTREELVNNVVVSLAGAAGAS